MKFGAAALTLALLTLALLIFGSETGLAQCSMCRKIATDGTAKHEVANNINYAILYLMAVPYFALAYIFRKQILGFFRQFRS